MWMNNMNNNEAEWAIKDPAGDNQINATTDYQDALDEQIAKVAGANTVEACLDILDALEDICEEFKDVNVYDEALTMNGIYTEDLIDTLSTSQQAAFYQAVQKFGHGMVAYRDGQFFNVDKEDVQAVLDDLAD